MTMPHYYRTRDTDRGEYNSAEHESLRAVFRCLALHIGLDAAEHRATAVVRFMGATCASELSPFGANYCRKSLEKMLPLRGDFAS